MNISRNTLLAAAVALTSIVTVSEVQACKGGRGGGYSGGSSRGYSSSSYGGYNSYQSSNYRHSAPVQSYAPAYHSQPAFRSQPVPPQFAQQTSQTAAIRPVEPVSQPQLAVAPQPQIAPQPAAPQQFAQAPQPQTQQPQVQQPQVQAPANAQTSALQALGGFAPPSETPAPAPQQQVQTPAHVGNWTATLGNGSTVQLALQADGNFSWVATNQTGSQSSFSGNYAVSNGSLTLNRSNDNQQLGGSLTINDTNTFSFQVAGTNAASINFSRS